ncbi:S9 family peptidase [Paraliomyxa miuraensis]|uniref:S9 family peptidase n=1 Tax=Paraliomyxa miuraensis TaxID=376150 RepID=UPI00225AEDCB|nr:S9 family peptidase [Paraliomyxa miuraensis]MCX4239789.1 S9 family peptidase [Paraliomyxa miuraensis]
MPPARVVDHRPRLRVYARRALGPALGALALALALACTQERTVPREHHDVVEALPSPTDSTTMTEPARNPDGTLPIEEVAKYPLPGTSIPGSFQFSPDGKWLTYLDSPDRSLTRTLYVEPVDEGTAERRVMFEPEGAGATEDNLSAEEKLQRERRRERSLGVTRYAWAKQAQRVLVPLRGDLWIQDGPDAQPRKVVDTEGSPALDPVLSRDGKHLAWVQDAELYTVSIDDGGTPRQLTTGARGTGKTHGLAEYIAQEEMGRHQGFWWSYDGEHLAYVEVDETHIPVYRINHQGRDDAHSHEDHGYPFAGEANAKVRLGVVPRRGGDTVWMPLSIDDQDGGGGDEELYLARVHWLPDGSLTAQLENREQTRLDLVRFDPRTGARTTLSSERSDVWINLHDDFRPLEHGQGPDAGGFVWTSEKSGFRHLYVHDREGKELRALTSGEWMVDQVVGVDETGGHVYFEGTKDGATERHVYRVALHGGPVERLTPEPGTHDATMSKDFRHFVDTYSDPSSPPRVTLRRTRDGSVVRELRIEPDPRVAALALRPPELVTLTSRDGVELHGAIYEPPPGNGVHPPFATIVSVYGGPHAQRVTHGWGMTVDLRAQYLASLGFVVFKLDNRGSARRGLAFEGAIKHDMGNLEVQDQEDGVRWLVERGLADPERVGIYGWSYGGYMSAMALARAPDTFKAAVAGAPVSSWDGYDTHYTERYMGTPTSNPEGYRRSSVLTHVPDIRGSLMIVHGLIDENVHFRHAARLVDALVKARKHHELLLFPDERHMPRSEADRVYMEERMRDFFIEELGPVDLVRG